MERDIKLAKSGQKDLIYKTMLGLKSDLSSPAKVPEILENKHSKDRTSSFNFDSENSEDDSEGNSEGNSEDNDETESETEEFVKSKFVNSARPKDESPESKKVRFFYDTTVECELCSKLIRGYL